MRDLQEGILLEFAERVVRFNARDAVVDGLVVSQGNREVRDRSLDAFRRKAKLCQKCGGAAVTETLCAKHRATHAATQATSKRKKAA